MLYTFESGNPSKPAIVFLHGGGLSSKSWYPIIERLPDFYCLAPDLPGHGESKEMPFTLEGSARQVAEIIRQKVPGKKAHLVGLSLGGAVVLTLLRLASEVADHVILSGSSGRLPQWLVTMSMPLLSVLRFIKPDTLVKSSLRQQGVPDRYYDLLYEDLVNGNNIVFLRQLYAELTKLELPQEIRNPLLVCVGEKEPGAARLYGAIALRPLRLYPSAQGVAMPQGLHVWPLQFPEVFADMVCAWVTDSPLPSVLKRLKV